MEFKLNKKNYQNYFLGSLYFGTGGGLSYEKNYSIAHKLLNNKKEITIKSILNFKKNNIVASIYGVGDPSKTNINFSKILKKAYEKYYNLTKIKLSGIIPGEIGGEIMSFHAATILKLPVVDTDLVGGRAAPKIQLDAFTIFNKPLTPLLAYAENDKNIFFEGNFKALEIENQLRLFFSQNKGSGILIGYPINIKELKNIAIQSTISNTLKFGELIAKKQLISALKLINGNIVAKEKIKKINLQSKNGFFQGTISLENYKINVKNENITLFKNNKKIISAPDLIMLIDKNFKPIHNTKIKKYISKEVIITTAPAIGYWSKEKNKKLWE